MRVGSGLLVQLERCGLSAKLADEHIEISEDASGSRRTRHEIARAFHANDQATLPEANAALGWLVSQPGELLTVSEPVDLIDETTGEVLVGGKPGATLVTPDGEVLALAWKMGDTFDAPEPDDDLGLVAMGLAVAKGRPFRVAHVVLKGSDVFPRRSRVFEPSEHPAILARIKDAVSRPRVACPGDWCGACRQNIHCPAWLARAKVALTVFEREVAAVETLDGAPKLEINNENAGALADRLKTIEKAVELAKEQLKHHVRLGGSCVLNGKEYYASQSDGRETVDVEALKAAGLFEQYKKVGQPYERFGWRKVRPVR